MLKKFYENFAKQNKYSVNVKIVFMNNIKLLSVKSYKNKEICVYLFFFISKNNICQKSL